MNSAAGEPKQCGYRSVALGIALVGAVLGVATVVAAVIVYERYGIDGVLACVLAAAVCWVSAATALFVIVQTSGGPQAVAGLMLSIGVRTFPPFMVGVASTVIHSRLADAGLFGLIVVFYLIALVAETGVAMKLISARSRASR